MTAKFDRVFVLLGPSDSLGEDEWIADATRGMTKQEPKVYRALKWRFSGIGEGSRDVIAIRPKDAGDVYRAAHQTSVLVVCSTRVRILLDPRKNPASPRTICTPASAWKHKATTLVAHSREDLQMEFEALISANPADIQGIRDPRILPLHLFGATDVEGILSHEAGRSQFIKEHRRNGSWVARSAVWQDASPQARHGISRDYARAIVSGWEIPTGHHWDVEPSGDSLELIGLDAVWHLKKGGYANTYPDSHIGGGRRSKRIWPT